MYRVCLHAGTRALSRYVCTFVLFLFLQQQVVPLEPCRCAYMYNMYNMYMYMCCRRVAAEAFTGLLNSSRKSVVTAPSHPDVRSTFYSRPSAVTLCSAELTEDPVEPGGGGTPPASAGSLASRRPQARRPEFAQRRSPTPGTTRDEAMLEMETPIAREHRGGAGGGGARHAAHPQGPQEHDAAH